AATAFDADAQSALADALFRHQCADLARRGLGYLNHLSSSQVSAVGSQLRGPAKAGHCRTTGPAKSRTLPTFSLLRRRLCVPVDTCAGRVALFLLVIRDRRLDGVFGEHGTVNLHGRQA